MSDPLVEEIDVNSHLSTWVTYSDGRKVDVGQLWESSAALTAYQKRFAGRKAGTGEGRLDTQSPMLTFQADDGSRVVMVLGGRGEHGISTHPRIAIRRFVLRQTGLDGLARRGLFPSELVPRLRAMVQCGFTVLVSGPPGAGKTTLLTELLGEVSPRERVITVEKNLLELRLEDDPRHPDAAGAVHEVGERGRRRRDHDPPVGRADASAQPGSGGRRRARGRRSARHARRRVDVQARLVGHHPCPHVRRRAAATRLLHRQVERRPA